MAFKSEQRFVSEMLLLAVDLTILDTIPIVKARILLWSMHGSEFVICDRFPDVPNFEELVLCIRSNIDAIAFACYVRDTFCMTNEYSSRSIACAKCSPVPKLDCGIVTTRKDDV